MHEQNEYIMMAVGTIIAAIVIIFIARISAVNTQLNTKVAEQNAQMLQMQEYREHNQFDNKHVYAQDIISAIFEGRGDPAVYVKSSKGVYQWSLSGVPCDYNTAAISSLIDPTVLYDASLIYGTNGQVIAYEFMSHVDGCGR